LESILKEIENNQKVTRKPEANNAAGKKPIASTNIKKPSSSLSRNENRSRLNSAGSQQSISSSNNNNHGRPTRSAVSFVSNTAKRKASRRSNHENARRHDDDESEGRSNWPPRKYQHVQGSGYGTRWKPETVKRNPLGELNRSLQERQNSMSRSPSGTRPISRNLSNENSKSNNYQPFANFNEKLLTQSGLLDDAFKSQELITKLKGINPENKGLKS
jgi:hypothetical protein